MGKLPKIVTKIKEVKQIQGKNQLKKEEYSFIKAIFPPLSA